MVRILVSLSLSGLRLRRISKPIPIISTLVKKKLIG